MFLFHVPCLSSSVRNVDNQNARNCVEIITGVVRCLGHCGTWCVMSKPNNGWQREDRLARKIHSRLGRQHKLRLQGRGKLFLSSAPFPPLSRVRLFCLTMLLPHQFPLNNYRAIQSLNVRWCNLRYYFSAFLSTFIIPLPVDTMGLEKH